MVISTKAPIPSNTDLPTGEPGSAEPGNEEMRRASVRGGAVTVVAQVAKLVLRTGSTAVLARALAPEDYGLVAMATVVTGFAGIFMDGGLGLASVQRTNLRQDQMSVLFWINIAIGVVLAAVIAFVSPWVASFYGEPRLVAVMSVLALSFILNSVAIQPMAMLHRSMQFVSMAKVEMLSMVAGIVVAVAMAYSGFGYWALVGLPMGQALANLILVFRESGWSPNWPKKASGIRDVLKFGFDVLGFNIIIYLCRKGDNLLIGWFWGAASLGLYDKAYGLLLLPISQINGPVCRVALPVMSRAKDSIEDLRAYIQDMIFCIASIGTILIAVIYFFADEIVSILLGPAWMECIPIFRALTVAALMGMIQNPSGWVLMAIGQTHKLKIIGGVNSVLFLSSFAIGLPHGLVAMAHCYSIASLLAAIWSWAFVARVTGIRFRSFCTPLIGPMVAGLLGFLGALLAKWGTEGWGDTNYRDLLMVLSLVGIYGLILLKGFAKWDYFASGVSMLGLKFRRH